MATLNNDLLRRLQSTIQAWGDEVAGAHAQLADQIVETRGQLEALSRILGRNGGLGEHVDRVALDAEDRVPPGRGQNGITNGNGAHSGASAGELEAARAEIASLTAKVEPLLVELDGLRRREAAQSASNQALTRELAELRPLVERESGDRGQEARRFQEIEDALRRREADLDEAHAESDTLLRRVEDRDNELEAVRASAALTAEVLSETEQALAELQEEYDVLQRESDEQATELRRIQKEVDALRDRLDAAEDEEDLRPREEAIPQGMIVHPHADDEALRRAEDEIQELLVQIEKLQQAEETLTRELNEARRDSAATLAELGDIQDRLARVKAERDAYFEETRALSDDLEVSQAKLEQVELSRSRDRATYEAEIAEITRAHSEQETRLADARRETVRLEENASAAAERTQELQRRLAELEAEVPANRDAGTTGTTAQAQALLKAAADALRQENVELAREVARAQERISLLEAEVRSAGLERAELEQELEAERAELGRLRGEWDVERAGLVARVEAQHPPKSPFEGGLERVVGATEREDGDVSVGAPDAEDRVSPGRADVVNVAQLDSARVEIAALRSELEGAQSELRAARERIVELEGTVRRKEVALQAVEESLAAETSRGRAGSDERAAALRESEGVAAGLRAELDRAESDKARWEQEVASLQKMVASLQVKYERAEREARGAEQDASMASQALHVNRTELERLRRELRATDESRAKYREESSELATRLERERTNAAKFGAEIAALQVEVQERALGLRQKEREFEAYVAAHRASEDAGRDEVLLELSQAKARAGAEVEGLRAEVLALQGMVKALEGAGRKGGVDRGAPDAEDRVPPSADADAFALDDRAADMELELLRREQEIIELNAQIEERDRALETFQRDFEALLLAAEGDPDTQTDTDTGLVPDDRGQTRTPVGADLSFGEKSELAALRHALEERDAEVLALRSAADSGDFAPAEFERIEVAAYDADGKKRAIGEILVGARLISDADLRDALAAQKDPSGARVGAPQKPLGKILVEKGLIREEVVAQVVAKQLGLPFFDLKAIRIEERAARLISGDFASSHQCIPMKVSGEALTVAMANPLDEGALRALADRTSRRIEPVMAAPGDISSAIRELYGA